MMMTIARRTWIGLLALGIGSVFLSAGCGKTQGTPTDTSHPAYTAAMTWLALVDEGKFDESWKESAPLFQKAVTSEAWSKQVQSAREPFGKVVTRKPGTMTVATSLPGAPDGEYVVFQLETSFEKKANSIETITPMKAPDGTWRVSGYYIK